MSWNSGSAIGWNPMSGYHESRARLLAHRHHDIGMDGDTAAEHVRKEMADCVTSGDVTADVQCRAQCGGIASLLHGSSQDVQMELG
jgi:hypothetical protein